MRIFVAGATGVIGRRLVPMLVDAGHDVVGLTRSAERARAIEAAGAASVVGDALDRDWIVGAVRDARPDAVIHQLTAIPDAIDPRKLDRQFEQTNRLRTEGTRNLLDGARAAGTDRFLVQSIAFAYDPSGAPVKDEDAPLMSAPPKGFEQSLAALRDLERVTLEANGTVLRYGQFYGPGTALAPDGHFATLARKRQLPIVGDGGGRFSFVSTEDAARGTLLALERGYRGVLNIVEDEAAPAREWVPMFAEAVEAPRPWRVPRVVGRLFGGPMSVYYMTEMRAASNARAREQVGFAPGSWREAFRVLRS